MELDYYVALNKLAEANHANGGKIAVILEGRDGAGKSGTIRKLTKYLPPYTYRIEHSVKPTKTAMRSWLKHWSHKMPKAGEIVFYDRSHYSRALLQPVMGWCSKRSYDQFMRLVNTWEDQQGVTFVKLWLSISEAEQSTRLNNRQTDPLRYWKYSPNDPIALSKFDMLTLYKERVLTETSNWHILDYNDKQAGRLEALKILSEVK